MKNRHRARREIRHPLAQRVPSLAVLDRQTASARPAMPRVNSDAPKGRVPRRRARTPIEHPQAASPADQGAQSLRGPPTAATCLTQLRRAVQTHRERTIRDARRPPAPPASRRVPAIAANGIVPAATARAIRVRALGDSPAAGPGAPTAVAGTRAAVRGHTAPTDPDISHKVGARGAAQLLLRLLPQ
jgi:hypothetical protein